MEGGAGRPPLLLLDLGEDKQPEADNNAREKDEGDQHTSSEQAAAPEAEDHVEEGKLVDVVQEADGALAREAPTSEEEDSSEDEWRVVQEQRPFCAAGPDCSILDAEHYVSYRHTALNKKERMQMEEMKALEASNKDKKTSGRWMDFLGRGRKNTAEKDNRPKEGERERKQEDKEKASKEEAKDNEKDGTPSSTPTSATTPSNTSPAKAKDAGGFTLKKIFGSKKSESDAIPVPEQPGPAAAVPSSSPPKASYVVPSPSPILTQAPTDSEASRAIPQAAAPAAAEGGTDKAEPVVVPRPEGTWMTKRRNALVDKIAEIKRRMQDSNVSGDAGGEEAATDPQPSEKLASFKTMVEELDTAEKELERVLAMGDSFYISQSQKRRLVEITPQGQVVACDLLYQSPFLNEWGPLTQQINFKGSLLSSAPSYAYCKIRLVAKDGRPVDKLQEVSPDDDMLWEVKLANAIRYIDEIKLFGPVDKSAQRKNTETGPGGSSFKLEWKNGSKEQWYAEDGEGLDRVLSYHLRAYGLRRAKQVGRLRGLWCLACTSYDSSEKQHEGELMSLWQAVFPGVQLTDRVSAQWKQLGFQGNDPATDFRGMGLLGLSTILYFARHHADTLSALLQQGRSYPWASTGINLTQMLFKSLKLDESLIHAADTSEQWDTPLFHFMTTKENEDERHLFEEVFCQCFLLFDRIWVSSNSGYMDFPNVLTKVSQLFEEILLQRPKNIADLHRRQLIASEQAKP